MKQITLIIIITFFAINGYSQAVNSNSELKHTTPVSRELGKVDGYLVHLPPGYHSNTKKYPLLVYLHGTGERGNGSTDLYKIARVGCPSRRVEEYGKLCFTVKGVEECFIVISPQLNAGQIWTAANQEPFWQHVLDNAGYRIDKDRVYLTGHSLGGIGTWEEAFDDRNTPNRFAAIAPLSYKISTSKICNVADKKIPVWAFCGEDDSYFGSAQGAINALRNCPGRDPSVEIKFTVVPDAGHSITGPTYRVDHSVYNPNVYEWLLTKKRGSASTTPSVPEIPGPLEAIAQSTSSIIVSWNDNSNNEDGFTIQRSTSSGTGFANIATLGADQVSFTNNGLSPATTYYYRIRAFNSAGNSAYTSQVSASTLATSSPEIPEIPGPLEAIAQSTSSIIISWNDNSNNEDGFTIQRSTSSGTGFANVGTLGADKVSFTDNGLTQSTQYYYRIRAFNDTGNSAYSSQVSATTFPTSSSSGGSIINWVNIHGAVQQGDDLESIASSGWGNSGAGSSQSIASNADGWIEMVIEDQSKADLVFGLSDANVNDNVTSTDHGFELSKYNNAYWRRENSNRNYLGTYAEGDKLRIERTGNQILYKKNGTIVATTNVLSKPSLIADVALLNTGSTVFQGRISSSSSSSPGDGDIQWVNIHGAVQQGNDLESIAPSGWGNSGAGSSQSISSNSDGWIEMVIEDQSKADLVFGLSDANVNDNVTSTDYGFELSKYNNAYWRRENTNRNYLGTYNEGDRLKIERSGTRVIYKKNGATVATTNVSSRPSLVADVALLNTGSTVFQGKISATNSGGRATEEVITGQTELSNEQSILVYPNPIGEYGVLTIDLVGYDLENEARFLLYNLTGMLVVDQTINSSSTEITLHDIPKSTYIYRLIQDGHELKSGRLIR